MRWTFLAAVAIALAFQTRSGAGAPHPDAAALRKILEIAASAKLSEGRFDAEVHRQLKQQVAFLVGAKTRVEAEKLLPELEKAAVRHARNRALLKEIDRLGGKATVEVMAPEWLHAIVSTESLALFGRITAIELNERSDGHKEPVPKKLSDRVTDDWLKNLAGQDELRRLELSGTAVTSAGLVHLKELRKIEILNVCLTAVDDRGFEHLAGMTNMRRMVVCSAKITGTGFAHLGGMKQIESINLHSGPASDAGLEAISKLTNLRRLEIVHTNVTDAGLKHLAALKNLRQLHVHGPQTTADALPFLGELQELYQLDVYDRAASNQTLGQIGKLPKLRMLMLTGGIFDDDAVKNLAKVTTLEEVSLDSSKLTEAVLDHLEKLPKLRKLDLGRTKLSPAGQQRLRAILAKANPPISIANPATLTGEPIECERIPLGEDDDYKPDLVLLPSGELLLVAFHQHKKEGGKVLEQNLLFRSADGGRSWSPPEKLDLLGREPYLTVLKDGTLFMTGHLLANDVRNKHGYIHGHLHRSTNGGKTWESVRIESEGIQPKASNHSTRNVLELADGTLLLGVDYDGGAGPYLMWRSTDGGKNWDKTGKCEPRDFKSKYGFFGGETWLWQARSGKIWALVRVDSNELPIKDRPIKAGNDQSDHFILFSSTDNGRTFERGPDFGDYGEMYMSILRLQDKRLLLTFTVRDLHPPLGVRAIPGVETDDGFAFDFAKDRLMLDTRTPKEKSQGGGFGPTVQLKDGTLVTAYSYRGADDKTHLEIVRWKLPGVSKK